MRIALISFFYKPAGGGVPRYVDNVSKRLAEMGHRVDIITASYNGKSIEKDGRVTVYRLPCMNLFGKEKDMDENSKEFLDFLRDYVKKKNPDMLSAQAMNSAIRALGHSLAVNIVSLESRIPTSLVVHGFIEEDEYAMLKFMMIKNLMWDRIIPVSATLAEDLFNKGLPSKKINVIFPPVDTKLFKPGLGNKWLRSRIHVPEKDILLLSASRLESMKAAEAKGVQTSIKALSSIKNKNVKLLIAAAPCAPPFEEKKKETIAKLKESAELLNVQDRVFIETFNPEEMPLVYNGADIFVMPSQMESFGLVYAEAMACGIPAIGTSVGGIPEVIEDGKTGHLISKNDHVSLAKELNTMIKFKRKSSKMGKEGRESIIEKCDLDKICLSLLGTFRSVINKRGGREHSLNILRRISKE
jgi:glycosyltransferase involved in cell wall biosynthesis